MNSFVSFDLLSMPYNRFAMKEPFQDQRSNQYIFSNVFFFVTFYRNNAIIEPEVVGIFASNFVANLAQIVANLAQK